MLLKCEYLCNNKYKSCLFAKRFLFNFYWSTFLNLYFSYFYVSKEVQTVLFSTQESILFLKCRTYKYLPIATSVSNGTLIQVCRCLQESGFSQLMSAMARRGQFCCFFLWHCGSVTGSTFTRSFYTKPSIWNNGWQRQPKSAPLVNNGAERLPKILSSVCWCCISNIVSVTGKPCPVGRDRAGRQCGAENNLCLSPHFVLKLCPKVHISVSVALASDNGVRRALHRDDGPEFYI